MKIVTKVDYVIKFEFGGIFGLLIFLFVQGQSLCLGAQKRLRRCIIFIVISFSTLVCRKSGGWTWILLLLLEFLNFLFFYFVHIVPRSPGPIFIRLQQSCCVFWIRILRQLTHTRISSILDDTRKTEFCFELIWLNIDRISWYQKSRSIQGQIWVKLK